MFPSDATLRHYICLASEMKPAERTVVARGKKEVAEREMRYIDPTILHEAEGETDRLVSNVTPASHGTCSNINKATLECNHISPADRKNEFESRIRDLCPLSSSTPVYFYSFCFFEIRQI